jgi:hypothetical protein
MRHYKNHYIPSVILLVLGSAYGLTLAPGLSWANGGADGGDLITAAITNGVPHPSGYPTYLLLAQFFQLIPIGTLAFRTNLLSAVCTIAAALTLFFFLNRRLPNLPSLIGTLVFGLAPIVWGQALITEVYGLSTFSIILFLYIFDADHFIGEDWSLGLTLGFAISCHLTNILLLPLAIFDLSTKGGMISPIKLLKRLAGIMSVLMIYLILPLRALNDSPVNWGNASSIGGFFWLISGQLYAIYPFSVPTPDLFLRLRTTAGLILDQFAIPGVIISLYGLGSRIPRQLLLASLWMATIFIVFSVNYGSYDSYLYLIPVFISFTIWLAFGINDLLDTLETHRPRSAQLLTPILILGLLIQVVIIFPSVDAAHDIRAENFGRNIVHSIPGNAIVIARNDREIFSLWYYQFALGRRPDVVVVAEGLLQYEWYVQTLTSTYPNLDLPSLSPVTEFDLISINPKRPICFVNELGICK